MHKSRFITSFVIFAAGFALSAIIDGRQLASLAKGTLSSQAASASPAQSTQKTTALQLWEYRVVSKYIQGGKGDIDRELDALGAQGFEILTVTQSSANIGSYVTIVLRRPKQ